MARIPPLLIALSCLLPAAAAAEGDRYGPERPALRGAGLPTSTRLLTWSSRERLSPPAPEPPPAPLRPAETDLAGPPPAAPEPAEPSALRTLPTSIYDSTATAPAPRPAAQVADPLTPRRYSVGREFGVEPDPIAVPAPSQMAYAPEVAEAVLAQQERDRQASDPGPLNLADQDLLEQRQADAEREAAREKARDKARRDGG